MARRRRHGTVRHLQGWEQAALSTTLSLGCSINPIVVVGADRKLDENCEQKLSKSPASGQSKIRTYATLMYIHATQTLRNTHRNTDQQFSKEHSRFLNNDSPLSINDI
jgi:hypothetical protein